MIQSLRSHVPVLERTPAPVGRIRTQRDIPQQLDAYKVMLTDVIALLPRGTGLRHSDDKESSMYHLMKSARYTLNHPVSGPMSSYRQFEVTHYRQANEALMACDMANKAEDSARHYVLNDTGQEYFGGTWID